MSDRAGRRLPETLAHGTAVVLGSLTLVCLALHAYLAWHVGVPGLARTAPILALAAVCALCAPRLYIGVTVAISQLVLPALCWALFHSSKSRHTPCPPLVTSQVVTSQVVTSPVITSQGGQSQ